MSIFREYLIDGRIVKWFTCITPGCENAICTWASEAYCFPCMESHIGHEAIVQRYNDTHPGTNWEEALADTDDEE